MRGVIMMGVRCWRFQREGRSEVDSFFLWGFIWVFLWLFDEGDVCMYVEDDREQ